MDDKEAVIDWLTLLYNGTQCIKVVDHVISQLTIFKQFDEVCVYWKFHSFNI